MDALATGVGARSLGAGRLSVFRAAFAGERR